MPRPRILIIAPHGSYRTVPFLAAAEQLKLDVVIASNSRHSLINAYAKGLQVDFNDPLRARTLLLEEAARQPFAGIIGTDDSGTELAAEIARTLDLSHNDPAAVRLARRKDLARSRLSQLGLPVPRHQRVDLRAALAPQIEALTYPCVVKPLALAASRGVIRVDDAEQFYQAAARINTILSHIQDNEERHHVLVEQFIPGFEVAVEAMLDAGSLRILTIFDKPDPLNGPFFEETYYITPSRLSAALQDELQHQIEAACRAYGLREGPIHAECRINEDGVWILEVAARTIGGLCARLLRFGTGHGLEELVLAQASGRQLTLETVSGGAGVLMIPIPRAGILRRVEGIPAARRVEFIDDIDIQVREGYELIPLPEGSSYLGFIFARAPSAPQAEAALRAAHAELKIVVAPLWKGIAV